MAGESAAEGLGRAFVEIMVPRAQFESQMAGVGTSFASHTSRMISEGQAASAAIAAANMGLINSYNMVTVSVMGLLSAQQMATLSANQLALALHQGQLAAKLAAAGAVDLSVGLTAVGGAAKRATLSIGSLMVMAKAVLPYMAAFAGITKTLSMASGATESQREFNKELYQLWTLTDLDQQGIAALGEEVRDLAYDYDVMAAHGTKAMYQIYSATFFGSQATEIFESGMKAAAAGVTDVLTAVDMVTTVLNAYGMAASEATRVNDLLFTAVRYGKTTYEELAGQFGRLAGVAAPAGARLEEMTAAIATLTRQGIMTDWAVTSLRQTIMSMFRPTGALAEAITDLGYESGRSLIQTNGFAGALKMIAEQAEKTGTPLENLFTNVRAITAVLPLVTTAAAGFALDMERTEYAAGTMGIAFEKVSQSWEYQITVLKSQLNDVGIAVGEKLLPASLAFLEAWTALADGFGAVAEILGPVIESLAAMAGYMAGGAAAAGALAAGVWLAYAALNVLASHPIVAGIMGLATAFGFVISKLDDMRDATRNNVDEVEIYLRRIGELRKEMLPAEIVDMPLPLPGIFPSSVPFESQTMWDAERAFEDFQDVFTRARVAEIIEGITGAMLTAVEEEVAKVRVSEEFKATGDMLGRPVSELEGSLFTFAQSAAELRVLQQALANETDMVAKTIAEGFGYTLEQIRVYGADVEAALEEAVPLTIAGPWDWFSGMIQKVADSVAKMDPADVEGTLEGYGELRDYLEEAESALALYTKEGWSGVEMLEDLRDRIRALVGEASTFAEETSALIAAFKLAEDGSIAQAEILDDLAGRYKTLTGWVEQYIDVESEAGQEILSLITALEALGLSAEKAKDRLIDVAATLITGIGGLLTKYGGEGMQGLGSVVTSGGGAISAISAATAIGAGPIAGVAAMLAIVDTLFTAWNELVVKPAAEKAVEEAAAIDKVIDASLALAESFWGLVESAESVAAIQEAAAQIQVDLLSALFGFLWPLADILTSITGLFILQEETIKKEVEARQKLLSNLNVPIGWPINRIRFAAGTPGEPTNFDWETMGAEEKEDPSEVLLWWQEAMEPFRNEILGAIQPIADFRDTVRAAYEAIFPSIIEGILPALETFGWTLDQISGWITDVFVDDLSTFAEGFGTFWTEKVDPFWKEDLFPQITDWLDRIYGWLDAIILFFSDEGWSFLTTDVWGAIKPFVDTVLGMFEDFGNWVGEHWDDIKVNLLDMLETYLGGIIDNIQLFLTDTEGWLSGTDGLTDKMSDWEWMIDIIGEALNLLRRVTEGAAAAFVFFGNLLGQVMNGIIWPFNALIKFINLLPGVNIPLIPTFEWIEPQLPHMGEGGIAFKPTPAIIGEKGPEAVVPLSQLGGMGGGATININLAQQRLVTLMMKDLTSKNVNDAGVGYAPMRF